MVEEMKVVTLNCWGVFTPLCCEKKPERFLAIAETLSGGEYDVICLQEVWTDGDFFNLRNTLAKSYPFAHYFHSNLIGSGCCLFSRHRILSTFFHRYTLNGYAQRVYHGDWFGGKGVGVARLRFKQFDINVYVTHLHAQYQPVDVEDEYRPHRVLQAYELARFIRMTGAGVDAVVLTGDLNLTPTSLGLRTVVTFGGLNDAWVSQKGKPVDSLDGATCTRPDNSFTTPKERGQFPRGERLDYIMFAPNAGTEMSCDSCKLTLRKVTGQEFNYSDHEGVTATLQLQRAVTAPGQGPNEDQCRALRPEIDEAMDTGLEQLGRDRLFYLGSAMLVLGLLWFAAGRAWLVGAGAVYLCFAIWSMVVVKGAERRGFLMVKEQLRFDCAVEEGR